ncbi:hypothetical protein [Mycolicibacterium komossense]|uniref:Integral membrane protein n=1 Tax=Mycolicibacterium komossense TaxID=1779 RepID=A0ABT3CFG7_9MYCO|nr:hypothetical protein [Mycolicibacterium komossense]MCV7228215.1 hypothetical protein [Mycolicibacterium komossense]
MMRSATKRSPSKAECGSLLSVAAVAVVLSAAAVSVLPALAQAAAGANHTHHWIAAVLSRSGQTGIAILENLADPTFYGAAAAGALMLAGGGVAYSLQKRRTRWAGFAIACDSGLWPWMVTAGILALLLSHLGWGWTQSAATPWQPLFVAFVSVTPAVVLMYGRGWKVAVTAAFLGAGMTVPAAIAAARYVCIPLGIPAVAGFTAAMTATAIVAFAVCRWLPWLERGAGIPASTTHRRVVDDAPDPPSGARHQPASWMLRRILADFTEAPFFGNEWASAGLIIGGVGAYLAVQPTDGVAALFPQILAAQLAASTLSVMVWRGRWLVHGWYPSFVPIVSVAPAAVIAYGASIIPTAVAVLLGVLVGPPLAFKIGNVVPQHVHRFVGCTGAMAICTATIIPVIGLLG